MFKDDDRASEEPGTDGSAFVPGPRAAMAPTDSGSLDGLSFAVKDLFDVMGYVTSYGHPDWARTHPPAEATAPVVADLLAAGARLAGKTKTVELAYGLSGENLWHGTPRNPASPLRFPGGSSCGSASAVAAGEVDFALGSDTGGSVRIPASYCGLYGIRPTHGAVSLAGARGLAPSMDTCGWFTRSADLLELVGEALLPQPGGTLNGLFLRVEEAWVNADPAVAAALSPAAAALRPVSVSLVPEGLATLQAHARAVQAAEVWATLGDWVVSVNPRLGPGVAERIEAARKLSPALAAAGRAFRRRFAARVAPLLNGGAVLVFPTSPSPAPLLTATAPHLQAVREATMGITYIASLAGLPEVTIPVGQAEGAPVGLSLVAAAGQDTALLALANEVAGVLGLPA
jgi:amidase